MRVYMAHRDAEKGGEETITSSLEDLLEDLPENGLPLTDEDREWLEAPPVGREVL
jgi:hypothetical protein